LINSIIIYFSLYSALLGNIKDTGTQISQDSFFSEIKFDLIFGIFAVPPEWVIEPKDTSVVAGQAVALHCQADGFPLPTVTWRKGHGNCFCS
jgi:hypothetical protein